MMFAPQTELTHLRQELDILESSIARKEHQIAEEDRLYRGRASSSCYMAICHEERRQLENKAAATRRKIEKIKEKMTSGA